MPRLVVVTDRSQVPGGDLAAAVAAVAAGGADAVLFREKDLPRADRAELGRSLADVLWRSSDVATDAAARSGPDVDPGLCCRLIVASDVELAREVGAAGVHLAAADPWPRPEQTTVPVDRTGGAGRLLVGRSCHNREELQAAVGQADYVTLSPVWETSSKPGYGPALGLDGLWELCRSVPDLPVLALGGITVDRVHPCLEAGASGVAVMGEVMRTPDPTGLVTALAAAVTPP